MQHITDEVFQGHEISLYGDEFGNKEMRVRSDNFDGEQIFTHTAIYTPDMRQRAFGFIEGLHYAYKQVGNTCNHGNEEELKLRELGRI